MVEFDPGAAVLLTIADEAPEPLEPHAVLTLFRLGRQVGPRPHRGADADLGTLEISGPVRFVVNGTRIDDADGLAAVRDGVERALADAVDPGGIGT